MRFRYVRIEHHGYPSGLRSTRGWDNVYNGLDGSCGKGKPLSKYEREEVVSVLGVQIAGGYSKIQGRHYFVNFLGISTALLCQSWHSRQLKKDTHGLSRTASYTAQMFSSTNCTNNGFSERPRRCL